jgi:hypothetical protein
MKGKNMCVSFFKNQSWNYTMEKFIVYYDQLYPGADLDKKFQWG